MSILRALPALDIQEDLETRLARVRDELFAVVDAARHDAPRDATSLHVSLQAACNELGNAERALRGDY
ncbi:MAG: hypothetical protein QOI91_569 [Solirubrobacteraceae bacterium]|jgi:hypothetical protein|nr:hypothetical protein [Solirubrobacteraceae bacterium]MDX6670206.1 hypothetical protein [Solirubrobacteraceae bacterium]